MNSDQVVARTAIESLRSGVPSLRAVERLGTLHPEIVERFEEQLRQVAEGEPAKPLAIAANFGVGKSHLLQTLRAMAADQHFVTSYVVVSPEMPLGDPHKVLRSVAETARMRGYEGRALREMGARLKTDTEEYASVRIWARDVQLDNRFQAELLLFERLVGDEEFRVQILGDFEGDAVKITEIRKRLKEIGQKGAYALSSVRRQQLAHQRIQLLARLFHAGGAKGWVVLFDECERLFRFPPKARLDGWSQIGWWRRAAETAGARLLPVFALSAELVEQAIKKDEPHFATSSKDEKDEWKRCGRSGIDLFTHPQRLRAPTGQQFTDLAFRLRELYHEAYPDAPPPTEPRVEMHQTIRSAIRTWITYWDIERCYPGNEPTVVTEEIPEETGEIDEDLVSPEDEDDTNDAVSP
jgi:hypothetical protein